MQYLFISVSAGALFLTSAAQAQIVSLGSTPTRSCYVAARDHQSDHAAIDACSYALSSAFSLEGKVAALVNRGIVYLHAGNANSALRDFDEAIRLDPNEPESYLNKGLLLLRMESRDRDVIGLTDTAITKNTRKPALAYFARAMANEGLGNVSAAYADYQRAAALAPSWQLPAAELRRFKRIG